MRKSHALVLALGLSACSAEERRAGPDVPLSAPSGADDPRIAGFERSRQQVSQGGRYFAWYGCAACHSAGAPGLLDLGDANWRHGGAFDQVYRSIAGGNSGQAHAYGASIPQQQLWQLTAFVRTLPRTDPAKRRRLDMDRVSEPRASSWTGPAR